MTYSLIGYVEVCLFFACPEYSLYMTYVALIIKCSSFINGTTSRFPPWADSWTWIRIVRTSIYSKLLKFLHFLLNFLRMEVLFMLLLLICNASYLGWIVSFIKWKVRNCFRHFLSHTFLFQAANIAWLDTRFL